VPHTLRNWKRLCADSGAAVSLFNNTLVQGAIDESLRAGLFVALVSLTVLGLLLGESLAAAITGKERPYRSAPGDADTSTM